MTSPALSGRVDGSDNCPMLSASARFLIWATRNARPGPQHPARPAVREQKTCS